MPETTVSRHPRKGTKGVKEHSRSLSEDKTVPHNPPEEEDENETKSLQNKRIDTFDKILTLSEDLPLQHERHMSIEDAIREFVSTMPPEWQEENMSKQFFKKAFDED